MGFRLRKSIKIIPGIRLNISKSGVSTTLGTRGASVNIGPRGARGTVGIPGTGISYSEKLSDTSAPAPQQRRPGMDLTGVLIFIAAAVVAGLWLVMH